LIELLEKLDVMYVRWCDLNILKHTKFIREQMQLRWKTGQRSKQPGSRNIDFDEVVLGLNSIFELEQLANNAASSMD